MSVTVGQLAGTLTQRVEELLPKIRERAAENEEARQLIDANFADLLEIGFFRALAPQEFGGLECDIVDYLQAIRLVASADPATAWSAGVMSVHAHGLAYFPDRVHEEIWGAHGPDSVISSASASDSTVERVDGGLRIKGRWRFSSGVDRTTCALLVVMVPNSQTGQPELFLAMVPRSDYEIDDTWFTSGLRGTGSKDILVKDAFVPDYRLAGPGWDSLTAQIASPLYSVPFITVFPIIFAAIVLGAAEGALALAGEKVKTRVRPYTGQQTVTSTPAIMRIGESTLELAAAATLVERHWAELRTAMRTGRPVGPGQVRRWRSEDAYVGRLSIRALDRLFDGAGASATFSRNPLQRFWRDAHTAGGHVYMDFDAAVEIYGREALALEPNPSVV